MLSQDVFEDNEKVYLIMELMTGGELFDRICNDFPNGYSEKQSSILIKKTLEAVEYFHEKVPSRCLGLGLGGGARWKGVFDVKNSEFQW